MNRLLSILLLFFTLINVYAQNIDSTKANQDTLKWIPPLDCEPCCHQCNIINPKEFEAENGSEKIIYLYYEGFDDKDCCIYTFGEFINNAVFQPKFKTQVVYLLDHQQLIDSFPGSKLSKELKEFCIAIVKYDKNGMKEIWNPYGNSKYKYIEKLKKK